MLSLRDPTQHCSPLAPSSWSQADVCVILNVLRSEIPPVKDVIQVNFTSQEKEGCQEISPTAIPQQSQMGRGCAGHVKLFAQGCKDRKKQWLVINERLERL